LTCHPQKQKETPTVRSWEDVIKNLLDRQREIKVTGMDTEPVSSFMKLLESGAMELKGGGIFTTEFSASDLEKLMRSMPKQSEDEMKRQGVTVAINKLKIEGRGSSK